MTARSPTWVTAAEDWPTPADCTRMTDPEARALLRHHVDQAIHAQLLADFHLSRVVRFTDIARRIAAAHPNAVPKD